MLPATPAGVAPSSAAHCITDKYGYQQFRALLLPKLLHVQLVLPLQLAAMRANAFQGVAFRRFR